jgi:lysophospholipase L1-like esterase
MNLLLLAALLAAAVVLCGYTTIRLPVRRKEGKGHIACVGDSVTYGCTLPLFFLRRYPAVLQRLIGSDAQTAAFAVNDRTLQNTGNKPFRKERAFRQSMEFRPDTVVILLGTNDSKDRNWSSAEAFRQQYAELIGAYRALPTAPRIVICTPPCAFKPINRFFYITNDAKLDRVPEIAEAVKTVAAESGAELVDLYALTQGRRELFGPDGLHPNAAGAKQIAEAVFQAVCNTSGQGGKT